MFSFLHICLYAIYVFYKCQLKNGNPENEFKILYYEKTMGIKNMVIYFITTIAQIHFCSLIWHFPAEKGTSQLLASLKRYIVFQQSINRLK